MPLLDQRGNPLKKPSRFKKIKAFLKRGKLAIGIIGGGTAFTALLLSNLASVTESLGINLGPEKSSLLAHLKISPLSGQESDEKPFIKGLRYTLFIQNTSEAPITCYSFDIEVLNYSPDSAIHSPDRKPLSEIQAGEVKKPTLLHIELSEKAAEGRWIMSDDADSVLEVQPSSDGQLDLLELKDQENLDLEILPQETETIAGSILLQKPGIYDFNFGCEYIDNDGELREITTPTVQITPEMADFQQEASAIESEADKISVDLENISSDKRAIRLDPANHQDSTALETAVLFAVLLGLKTDLYVSEDYVFDFDPELSELAINRVIELADQELIDLLRLKSSEGSSLTLVISDTVTDHAVNLIGVSGQRVFYDDVWKTSSFLQRGLNSKSIDAQMHGDGVFSVTEEEFLEVVVLSSEMNFESKLSADEVDKLSKLLPQSYYESAARKILEVVLQMDQHAQDIIINDSEKDLKTPKRSYYADGTKASTLAPSAWLKSEEYIPPISSAQVPHSFIQNRLIELQRVHEKSPRLFISDRYSWAVFSSMERFNPDTLLAMTLSAYNSVKFGGGQIELYLFDGKERSCGRLTGFEGSPSRIYFQVTCDHFNILSLGNEMGVQIAAEGSDRYSISWKEYELLIAGFSVVMYD